MADHIASCFTPPSGSPTRPRPCHPRRHGITVLVALVGGLVLAGWSQAAQAPAPGAVAQPAHIVARPIGSYRIFVSGEHGGTVSVIDPGTAKVTTTFPVGKRPRGIHGSADGRTVYVALSGSPIMGPPPGADAGPQRHPKPQGPPPRADKSADGIGVIDARTLTETRKILAGSDPEQFCLSQDGKLLCIANEDVATASLIDLATGQVSAIIPVGTEPEGVSVDPTDSRFFVTCETTGDVRVIDRATAAAIGRIVLTGPEHGPSLVPRPRTIAIAADGKTAFVPSETTATVFKVDLATDAVITTLVIPGAHMRPMGTALSLDGRRLFVSLGTGGKVAVIDTGHLSLLTLIPVGRRPWSMALAPDGRLYVANGPSNDVSVIDTTTDTEIHRIPCPGSPWGITVVSAPH